MEKLKRCVSAKNLATSEKKIIAFFRIINYYTDMRIITDFFVYFFTHLRVSTITESMICKRLTRVK